MHFYTRIVRFWKTGLVLIFILTLCLIPSSDLRKIDLLKFNYQDLVVHLIMFTTFSILLFHDLQKNAGHSLRPATIPVLVMSMSMLLGISTEMLQYVLISLNRTASFSDLIFDLIGATMGTTTMRLIKR